MDIKPIRLEADYERALRRVEELWDSPEGSAEGDELDILTTLIEAYEREHFPIDLPDPIEAIKFRLEQTGKDSKAMIGIIGQRTRVYEVMGGKRPLSLNMIRNLHDKLDNTGRSFDPTGTEIPQARGPWRGKPAQASRAAQVGLAGDGNAGLVHSTPRTYEGWPQQTSSALCPLDIFNMCGLCQSSYYVFTTNSKGHLLRAGSLAARGCPPVEP